jgi:hypothetical protein
MSSDSRDINFRSETNMLEPCHSKNRSQFSSLRQQFEEQLNLMQNRSHQIHHSAHNSRDRDGLSPQNSIIKEKETSILIRQSDLNASLDRSLRETGGSKKFSKSVRFQVYNAKNIDGASEMRQQMHEKFNELNESLSRGRSPPKPTKEQARQRLLKKCLTFCASLEDLLTRAEVRHKVTTFE